MPQQRLWPPSRCDQAVSERLRRWLVTAASRALEGLPPGERAGSKLQFNLASMLKHQGVCVGTRLRYRSSRPAPLVSFTVNHARAWMIQHTG